MYFVSRHQSTKVSFTRLMAEVGPKPDHELRCIYGAVHRGWIFGGIERDAQPPVK